MALASSLAVDIVGQAAIKAFNDEIQALNSFSLDFSADAVKPGEKIKFVWTPSGATVRDYNAEYGYLTEQPTQLPKELSINTNKYVGFEYSDDDLAKLSLLKLDAIGSQYGAALAGAVLADIWGVISADNFEKYFVRTADGFDSDDVLELGKECTDLKWPNIGRNMIVNTTVYTSLCKDSAVKNVSASGGIEALRQGKVPNLGTFENIYQSTVIPTADDLIGFAVNREAIGIAFRAVRPDASAEKIMDYLVFSNDSGMTIALKDWYDPKFKTTRRIMEVNYGKCVGNPDALIRIISEDPEGDNGDGTPGDGEGDNGDGTPGDGE